VLVIGAIVVIGGKLVKPDAPEGQTLWWLRSRGLRPARSWLCYFRALKLGSGLESGTT